MEYQIDDSDNLIPPKVVFACVTEPTKKFLDQAARLVMSLRWFGGKVADARFVVGCPAPLPAEAEGFFKHFEAEITEVKRYDQSHGPSNKIALLLSLALKGADVVVLMDCDTVIVRDPSPWLTVAGVAAKLADLPTVSLGEIEGIFRLFKLEVPEPKYTIELTGDPTIAYCNSGLVIMRAKWREVLAREWDRWNRILLEGTEHPEFNRYHVDQMSLALAIHTGGVPFDPLPSEMNMPTHLPQEAYPPQWHLRDPIVIHYHGLAYPDGFLQPCSLQKCAKRIGCFNAKLRAEDLTLIPSSHILSNKPKHSKQDDPKVVVGSGWWCDESSHEWSLGSDATRTVAFFDVWYRQVVRTLNPQRIVVTDSASPVKPDHRSYLPIEWIELDRNYGHVNDVRVGHVQTKYSGFTRSVINGAMYALCCDADFYVYVEQDCLIHGEEFLRQAIGDSKENILLGSPTVGGKGLHGSVAAPMLQVSLMIVRRDGLERFLEGILGAPWTDGEKSPEEILRLQLSPYGYVNVPYGRSRPLDFTRSHFYAQHLDDEELQEFLKLEQTRLPDTHFAFSAKPENQREALPEQPQRKETESGELTRPDVWTPTATKLEASGDPDISVVIPCFNQAEFLPYAIESVLAQTYQNFEIIVVNDGSTDNTQDVATRYPVSCISQSNKGLSSARNTGIRNSKGKFLVFLDADDLLTPRALETGREAFLKYPEVAFVYGRFQRINADGKDLPTGRPPLVTSHHYRHFLERLYLSVASVMFRREVFIEVGEFDTSLKSCEDYDIYLRILRDRVAFCHDKIVTKRRIHGGQMIKASARMLRNVMKVRGRQKAFVKQDPELASAFQKGRRHYEQWYGEQLVMETHLLFRLKRFWKAMTNWLTLVRYYPQGAVALLKGLPESNHVQFSVGSEHKPSITLSAHPCTFAITELHPWSTPVGTGFNVQPDGRSAIGVVCQNATSRTTIIFDGEPLETNVRDDSYVTAFVPDHFFSKEGKFQVYLIK